MSKTPSIKPGDVAAMAESRQRATALLDEVDLMHARASAVGECTAGNQGAGGWTNEVGGAEKDTEDRESPVKEAESEAKAATGSPDGVVVAAESVEHMQPPTKEVKGDSVETRSPNGAEFHHLTTSEDDVSGAPTSVLKSHSNVESVIKGGLGAKTVIRGSEDKEAGRISLGHHRQPTPTLLAGHRPPSEDASTPIKRTLSSYRPHRVPSAAKNVRALFQRRWSSKPAASEPAFETQKSGSRPPSPALPPLRVHSLDGGVAELTRIASAVDRHEEVLAGFTRRRESLRLASTRSLPVRICLCSL